MLSSQQMGQNGVGCGFIEGQRRLMHDRKADERLDVYIVRVSGEWIDKEQDPSEPFFRGQSADLLVPAHGPAE